MRRIVVAGGFGFFGSAIVQALQSEGHAPLVASRRASADVRLDVENAESIAASLRGGDVVVDAVGPYQARSMRLLESACEIGFDVVDLADSLTYVSRVYGMADRFAKAGICVYTACSGMSSISAAAIRLSGIASPVRLTGFLVPATRYTAVEGTAASLFASVGRPIQGFSDGAMQPLPGWGLSRRFPMPPPVGTRRGYLFECADSITLPRIWPSLRTAEFYVDTNVRGLNRLFCLAARWPTLRSFMDRNQRHGLRFSRLLGREAGGLGYEVEGDEGQIVRLAFTAVDRGYVTAIAPTVLAARQLAAERVAMCGLIPPDQHIETDELLAYVQSKGVTYSKWNE